MSLSSLSLSKTSLRTAREKCLLMLCDIHSDCSWSYALRGQSATDMDAMVGTNVTDLDVPESVLTNKLTNSTNETLR